MIPDLATHSKGLQRIRNTLVGDEFLHEPPVQSPLHLRHPDKQDMLCLHREGVLQNNMTSPLNKSLQLLMKNMSSVLHQSHILGSGVRALTILNGSLKHVGELSLVAQVVR